MAPVRLVSLLVLLLAVQVAARAETLILSLSDDVVRIESNFAGDDLVVFGVIERDATTVSRGAPYEVVVTLTGPRRDMVARRKERFAGIWVNRGSQRFANAPSYYAVSGSRPLDEFTTEAQRQRLEIGTDALELSARLAGTPVIGRAREEFVEAFVRLKTAEGRIREVPDAVEFIGRNVFRVRLPLPADVPLGTYRVRAFLFAEGGLLGEAEATMQVTKFGFEQFVFETANRSGLLYGLVCVLLAIFTGWVASILFRKD